MSVTPRRALWVVGVFLALCVWLMAEPSPKLLAQPRAPERIDSLDPCLRPPFTLSADGKTLVYVTADANSTWLGANTIHRVEVTTGREVRLFADYPECRFSCPSLSPDGKKLVFQYQTGAPGTAEYIQADLFMADLPADLNEKVTAVRPRSLAPGLLNQGDLAPRFTNDGKGIWLAFGKRHGRGNGYGAQRVYFLGADDRTLWPLSKPDTPRDMARADEFLALSLDGEFVLTLIQSVGDTDRARPYRRRLNEEGRAGAHPPEAYPVPERAGILGPMSEQHVLWPAIAAASKVWVCQVGANPSWSIALLPLELNGTPTVELHATETTSFAHPALLTGGNWIAFERWTLDGKQVTTRAVWIRNLRTGHEREIATDAQFPQFTPDGERLYFMRRTSAEGQSTWRISQVSLKGIVSEEDMGRLSVAEREKIIAIVAKLGADNYSEREAASDTLKALGDQVIGELRALLADQTDPEIKVRLTEIIRYLAQPRPRRPQ